MASSPRFTFIVFILGVFAGAVPLRSSQGQTYVESAQKEGEVVVYGANLNETMDPMHKAFEKKYGVAVKYWRGASTALATRATSEWRSGRPDFDVVQGNRGVQLIMAKEGLFIRHVTPSAEKFPAQFRDPDGLLSPMSFLPIGILYNRELVKGADVPKSFDDLLDPKWRGKVVIPDPAQHVTAAQFMKNMEKLKGAKWLDWVKALAEQKPLMVASLAPVPIEMTKGEALVGITYVKYVLQHKGPIEYAATEKYLTDANYLSVGAKARHPNAAKLYVDYASSAEGQEFLAQTGDFVLYPGIHPPVRAADKVVANMVIMDTPTEQEMKKLREDFREIFLAK
jgi:iron(III) transport system substrate-binding protein